MNGQTLAVSNNWLDGDLTTSGVVSTITAGSTGLLQGGLTTYQCYPSYYYWTTPALRPIRLAMSEVERLRKAAKADEKLKAILAKFTSQIEVIVDFD
jgi:hypothetical protein